MIRELEKCDFKNYINLISKYRNCNMDEIEYQSILNYIKNIGKVFIYIENECILGTATVFIENKFIHNGALYSYIEDVFVDPNYKSKGIGTQLIKKCIDYCNVNNVRVCKLNCDQYLTDYYRKFGFKNKGINMYLEFGASNV